MSGRRLSTDNIAGLVDMKLLDESPYVRLVGTWQYQVNKNKLVPGYHTVLVPEADHCEERPAKQFDPAEVGLSVGLRRLPTLASQEPILVFRQLVDVMRTSP